MAKAYSVDLRERVLFLLESGLSAEAISNLQKVCTKTIVQWKRLKEETGSLEPRKRGLNCKRKIDRAKLEAYVTLNNDKTLKEYGEIFGVTGMAIHKVLKQLGYSYKKKLYCTGKETSKKDRYIWRSCKR